MDKRLVRPTNDRMLAGVCVGLANYFNIDTTLVRLLFVAAVFIGGVSPLAYLILWLVMPEVAGPAPAQQLRQDPTGEWQYDPYTGERIRRP